MNSNKFDQVLGLVSNGKSQTEACSDSFTTIAHLTQWLAIHPQRPALMAALLQAESDARRTMARQLQADLSRRINEGAVTSTEQAKSEQSDITRMFEEAGALRLRAEKTLAQVPVPDAGFSTTNSRTGSWTDSQIAKSQLAG